MAPSTRDQKELKCIRDIIGPSCKLPSTNLPTLGDVLRALLFKRESILGQYFTKTQLNEAENELMDEIIVIYQNAHPKFQLGTTLIEDNSLKNKIHRSWDYIQKVSKSHNKTNIKDLKVKVDKIFDIFKCKCVMKLCGELHCSSDCKKTVHINCKCVLSCKLPESELVFIYHERNKVGSKGHYQIGSVDQKELKVTVKRKMRQEKQQENLKKRILLETATFETVTGSDFDSEGSSGTPAEEEYIPEFVKKLAEDINQNRKGFKNLARETLRCELSTRDASLIATAVLMDVGIISASNADLIIDKSKLEREIKKLGEGLKSQQSEDIQQNKVECVFFDGREDKSLTIQKDDDGITSSNRLKENHYSITDPLNYVDHITLQPKAGAKGLSKEIGGWIRKNNQSTNVKALGSDSTNMMTGHKGGAIHHIECELNHKCLWCICQLHTNELPLRELIKKLDGPTTGEHTFSGNLGKTACGEVHLFEVNRQFKPLSIGEPPVVMPDSVVKDLSTDQKYLYEIVKIIRTGTINERLIKQKIGPVDHSRWLTTANRLCRLYISKHDLDAVDLEKLETIVSFIIYHYAVMWFQIKCYNKVYDGPRNALKNLSVLNKYAPKQVLDIVRATVNRGSWHAHSENVLYSLLCSDKKDDRLFAVKQILKIRGDEQFGNAGIRPFHVPEVKWDASSLFDIIDWSNDIHEPIVTCDLSTNDLQTLIDIPLVPINAPCHTQSCERAVKEVTKASDKYASYEKRHISILAKMESRKHVKKADTKKQLRLMLKAASQ